MKLSLNELTPSSGISEISAESGLLQVTAIYSTGQMSRFKIHICGTFLVVQWLRLHAPNAGGQGLILDQGTKSHMLQLRSSRAIIERVEFTCSYVTTKTWCSQINKENTCLNRSRPSMKVKIKDS